MKPETIIQCIELQLGKKGVKLEDRFYEDLGAESIDMLHVIAAVEEISGVFVPEEQIPELYKVSDLFDYVIANMAK